MVRKGIQLYYFLLHGRKELVQKDVCEIGMNDHGELRLQLIAVALIIVGLTAVAMADKSNFRDLANGATMVLGIGATLLTGKSQSQFTKTGDIKNVTSDKPEDPKE